ncbi:MAG: hypothetical protein H6720_29695 [Sandaracinus sp.]|nr:hypothetical protein [Sandaracinus sp.]
MHRWLLRAALTAALLGTFAPSLAEADAGPKIWNQDSADHHFHIDLQAGFSWWGRGFAGGARFNIPLLKKGFLRGHNDAFFLSVGVDTYFVRWRNYDDPDCNAGRGYCWRYGLGLGFPVVAHWEFYLWQKFSVFGEAGANVYLHPAVLRGRGNDFVEDPGAWVVAAVGVRWRFGRTGSFVARLGLPYAAIGVSFEF